jgi:hypothetical protein
MEATAPETTNVARPADTHEGAIGSPSQFEMRDEREREYSHLRDGREATSSIFKSRERRRSE